MIALVLAVTLVVGLILGWLARGALEWWGWR
jgi:hypothetical protein